MHYRLLQRPAAIPDSHLRRRGVGGLDKLGQTSVLSNVLSGGSPWIARLGSSPSVSMTMSPGFASISDERSAPDGFSPGSHQPRRPHGPATSIASFVPTVSKPLILPANPCGSVRSSAPPLPVNETVWPGATVESNSSVEAPEISSVPLPATAPCRSSVAAVTSIVPVLVTAGVIALAPVPPVFSSRPALSI